MIGFGVAITAIAPVTWGWRIALFLVIMLLVGVIIPAIGRARRNPSWIQLGITERRGSMNWNSC